jgi:Cu(I)/Ag(I) efflux system periplasmic protein CusF
MERDNGYQPARRKPMSIMRTVGATVLAAALLINVTAAQDASISGEVKKIDAGSGKITLKHGPAKSLGMDEPMTMVYRVKDPALLKQVKVGDKVKFEAEEADKGYTVTKLQKAK